MITNLQYVFESGKNGQPNEEGVASYRIPALLKTKKGTLIAGADRRHQHYFDWGNIDMVIKRSEDDGQNWQNPIIICDLPTNPKAEKIDIGSAMNIDMALVQDYETERIFAFFDMFPEMQGAFGLLDQNNNDVAYSWIEGKAYLNLYHHEDLSRPVWTIREEGKVFDNLGNLTEYRVQINSNNAPYSDLGDIYLNEEKIGNVYFTSNATAPFRIARQMYIWMAYSDDEGVSWSCPQDMTPQVKLPWMNFYGVGPGIGLCLHTGEHVGRLIIPSYSTNHPTELDGSQSARVMYSDDNGLTWTSGESVNDNRLLETGEVIHSESMFNRLAQNTESVAVQLKNGQIKMFMRNLTGNVQVATSDDGGQTWNPEVETIEEITDVYVQLTAIQTNKDGKEYILLTNAEGPKRENGVIHLLEVETSGNLIWKLKRPLQDGKFAYNAIQQLSENTFGVLYEHADEEHIDYCLCFKSFDWNYIWG